MKMRDELKTVLGVELATDLYTGVRLSDLSV